jgi:two-component system sensor histidine kinase DesK
MECSSTSPVSLQTLPAPVSQPPHSPPDKSPKPAPKRPRAGLLIRYIWIVYSAFFFIQPIIKHSLREWLIFIPFYLLFLFFYIYPEFNRPAAKWCVLALVILGLVYVPHNEGASGIFIFAAAFLPFVIQSARNVIILILALAAIVCAHGYYFHIYPGIWGSIAAFIVVLGFANLSQAREKRANARLLRAQEEIEHLATVAERERIARDLHDLLGHTLSVITLKAELAGKLLHSDPTRAASEIADVEQTARRALAEVREAVGGYRALGLPAEIARARQTLAAAGVELTADDCPTHLPAADETVLSLILREAVTNIVRHAQAKKCTVQFATEKVQTEKVQTDKAHILLTIADDGRGGLVSEGNGLRGMRERCLALGGQFSWQSAAPPRHGVKLSIQLPLHHDLPLSVQLSAPAALSSHPNLALPNPDPILAEPRS